MDRGAWQATIHGITWVRHDLVTKPPPPPWNRSRLKDTENRLVAAKGEGRSGKLVSAHLNFYINRYTIMSYCILYSISPTMEKNILKKCVCIYVWVSRWLSGKESACSCRRCSFSQSCCQEGALEWEMAPHSSILAREIPWIEEPGGLQSMALQRVRHDWAHMCVCVCVCVRVCVTESLYYTAVINTTL